MVVIGLGVDIIQISRFAKLLTKSGGINSKFTDRFVSRILHPLKELPEFERLRKEASIDPCIRYISGSWAAKEALFKTLDAKDQKSFQFKDWYRYKSISSSKPFVGSETYLREGEEFLLSISHDGGFLIANVLRQRLKS